MANLKDKITQYLRSEDKELVLIGISLLESNFKESEWEEIMDRAVSRRVQPIYYNIKGGMILYKEWDYSIYDHHICILNSKKFEIPDSPYIWYEDENHT